MATTKQTTGTTGRVTDRDLIAALRSDLEAFQARVSLDREQIEAQKAQIANLADSVGALQQTIGVLNQRLEKLDGIEDRLGTWGQGLQARVDSAQRAVDAVTQITPEYIEGVVLNRVAEFGQTLRSAGEG